MYNIYIELLKIYKKTYVIIPYHNPKVLPAAPSPLTKNTTKHLEKPETEHATWHSTRAWRRHLALSRTSAGASNIALGWLGHSPGHTECTVPPGGVGWSFHPRAARGAPRCRAPTYSGSGLSISTSSSLASISSVRTLSSSSCISQLSSRTELEPDSEPQGEAAGPHAGEAVFELELELESLWSLSMVLLLVVVALVLA